MRREREPRWRFVPDCPIVVGIYMQMEQVKR